MLNTFAPRVRNALRQAGCGLLAVWQIKHKLAVTQGHDHIVMAMPMPASLRARGKLPLGDAEPVIVDVDNGMCGFAHGFSSSKSQVSAYFCSTSRGSISKARICTRVVSALKRSAKGRVTRSIELADLDFSHSMVGMFLPVDTYAANSRYCISLEERRRTADRPLSAHSAFQSKRSAGFPVTG